MGTMEEWNRLVDKNWDYWEYYRDMYDFSLTKAANTLPTSFLYPLFYQEKLLKKQFVDNMQQLGEIKPEEIAQFEEISNNRTIHNAYSYFKKPTGGFFWYFNYKIAIGGVALGILSALGSKSISWYFCSPLLFTAVGHMVAHQGMKINLGSVVDMSEWAIQQRKGKVWLEEKKHQTSRIATLPNLRTQILDIVKGNKP
ncbi:hypothetical protein SteCoe_16185 [Stentor coeruleus]|uniref:Uncharacterized protein n=1 Tax=Stentor coeruleus TaxID=5963 RepID=A0A1R2C1R3_9CILI|nr:hypothetical protein SteCoe_16185 [Stentor coeruleus]